MVQSVFPTTPWGDIIPPFTYKDGDEIKSFEGLNWNLAGQATYHNGCVTPAEKVSPTITPVVVCGPNNDTYTTTDYDAAIMTKTESLWVNNSKSITFSMSTSAYTFADYATSVTLTLVDAATQCTGDEPPVITPCTVKNNTYIQPWTFDKYQYPEADAWPTGTAGTYTFTSDGLTLSTPNEESYVSGLIDAGATPLRDIDTMKYKTLRQATSTGNAIQVAAYVLYVDLDGDIATTNDQTYYVYEPAYNGTVQTGVWQTWDVLQGGNSK